MPVVNANTRQSIDTSSTTPLVLVVSSATRARLPHRATASPAIVPAVESAMLSVRSCRTSWPRVAPSDNRTANSRRLLTDCASSRFAMLAHAMVSTRPTMPSSTSSGWL